jgi:putative transposase
VRSVRREALDWILVFGERQLGRILNEYVEHYNTARPHRSLGLSPPEGLPPGSSTAGAVIRRDRLGGLIHEYSRAA